MSATTHRLKDPAIDSKQWRLRVDLAACFRMAAELEFHESVANHFSAAVSDDGKKFLMNPRWKHFALLRASDLQLLDSNDKETMAREDAPDPSAWSIHSSIHANVPNARVVLHCHPPYATALAGLKDPSIKPIDQNTARFYNRITIDLEFGGLANTEEEGDRITAALGQNNVMMMGNHGVTVIGQTAAEAFEDLYMLERACRTMVLAYQTGQPLNIMSDDLAEKTAAGWDDFHDIAFAHFEQFKQILDKKDPSYAD
jgi:ribulose-5-phosphate 4-epimerase/fuculose-1-phosphate aldolase